MDNDQISGRSPPRQETISLADVALQRGHSSAEPNTARDNEYTSGIISYISIPYDQQSQLSDTVDISSSTSEKEETIESDDDDEWREIHELLFKSGTGGCHYHSTFRVNDELQLALNAFRSACRKYKRSVERVGWSTVIKW